MNLSSRISFYLKRLNLVEGIVATLTFTVMAILPFTEAFARILGMISIPASQVIVQHLTLWVGLIGAVLATRRNKLLALTQRPLFAVEGKFHLGRYIAKLMTFLVLVSLAWGSWELVKVEMVLMRLIKADKRLAERIQERLNFSNYQMLCLSWVIGLVMGIAIAILFFKSTWQKNSRVLRPF